MQKLSTTAVGALQTIGEPPPHCGNRVDSKVATNVENGFTPKTNPP
jgi:hypothetical protein